MTKQARFISPAYRLQPGDFVFGKAHVPDQEIAEDGRVEIGTREFSQLQRLLTVARTTMLDEGVVEVIFEAEGETIVKLNLAREELFLVLRAQREQE